VNALDMRRLAEDSATVYSSVMEQSRITRFGQYVRSHTRFKHVYLAAIVLLHIGYAIFYQVRFWNNFPDGDMNQVPDGTGYLIALVILLYLWFRADARYRKVDPPLILSVLVPLLFPVGVPYYFLRTYSRRRALLHIGLAVAFALACLSVANITGLMAFYYIIVAH
jgi:hypothetical protein